MKREFLINIILLFIINLMIKPVYIFGIEARVQDTVGLESYGLYFFYFNFLFLFQFINDPGLQNWNAQFIPKNRNQAGYLIPEILQAKLVFGFIFILITHLLCYFLGYVDFRLIFYISLGFVLSSVFMVMRGMIAGSGHYRADSLISVADKVLMIIILGYILYFSPSGLDFQLIWFVQIQCFTYLLVCLFALFIIHSKYPLRFKPISYRRFLSILKSSVPFVWIMIFMTVYNKLDGVMLGWLIDDNKFQAGLYAAAYRFYEAGNMAGYLFASLLLPMYAAHINQKPILHELINIGTKLTATLYILLLGVIFFYGSEILKLFYSEYQPSLYQCLQLLTGASCMVAVSYIFGTYVTATGKLKKLNIVFASGLCINICLCLLLIPKYGAPGAAWSTLLTQFYVMIRQVYLMHEQLSLEIKLSEVVRIIVYAFSIFLVFWLVIETSVFSEWVLNLGASILICLPLSFIFKILDRKDITLLSGK